MCPDTCGRAVWVVWCAWCVCASLVVVLASSKSQVASASSGRQWAEWRAPGAWPAPPTSWWARGPEPEPEPAEYGPLLGGADDDEQAAGTRAQLALGGAYRRHEHAPARHESKEVGVVYPVALALVVLGALFVPFASLFLFLAVSAFNCQTGAGLAQVTPVFGRRRRRRAVAGGGVGVAGPIADGLASGAASVSLLALGVGPDAERQLGAHLGAGATGSRV